MTRGQAQHNRVADERDTFAAVVKNKDLWLEGVQASTVLRDTALTVLYRDTDDHQVLNDEAKVTVVQTDLDVFGADETTALRLDRKADPGAFLWYNRDDDDENDTEDREDPQVTGENDLLKATCSFNSFFDSLDTGCVVIERENDRLRLWRSKTKGADQEIAFVSNRAVYNLADEDERDTFATVVLGKDLWVEGYQASAQLRDTGLTLSYQDGDEDDVAVDSVDATVFQLQTTAMSFNHTRAHDTWDGVNLRRNADENEKIIAPEWCVDGADAGTEPDTDDAALYVRSRRVTLNASFAIAPAVNTALVRAVGKRVTLAGSDVLSLGNLGDAQDSAGSWVTVTFTAGNATDVSFTPQNATANSVLREEALFHWEVREIAGVDIPPMEFTLAGERTPIMIYTILGPPRPPWNATDTAGQDITQPWECLLRVAASDTYPNTNSVPWGHGATTPADALSLIVGAVNGCGRFTYDTGAHFVEEDPPGTWSFDLTGFLNGITGIGGANDANCHDVAAGVVSFANILGAATLNDRARHMYLGHPTIQQPPLTFVTEEVLPIGLTTWGQQTWSCHGVAWRGPEDPTSSVFDACLHVDLNHNPNNRAPDLPRDMVWTTYVGHLGNGTPDPTYQGYGFVTFSID